MSGKVPLLHFPKNARRTLPPMLEHVRCGGNGFLRLVQHAKFGQGGLLRVLEHRILGRGGLSRPPLWRKCSSFQLQCVRFAGALKPKKSIAERGTDAGHKSPALPSVLLASILLVLATFASAQTPRQKTRMATSQVEATGPIAIRGGKLLTITHGVIENGVVLMENGKITAVGGAGTAIPRGATVVDAAGMTVYPGLIDSETNLGLVEVEADQMSNDLNEPSDEIMPHMHVADAFHSETQRIPVVRVNGITNAIVAPGTEDSLPGQDIFIQLDGKDRDQMIMVRDIALPLNFSAQQRRRPTRGEGGLSNRFPATRMGLATQLRQAFIDAQDYEAKQQAASKKPEASSNKSGGGSDRQKRDLKFEALLPYLHGQKPVVIGARDGYDLENAMRLAHEFNL